MSLLRGVCLIAAMTLLLCGPSAAQAQSCVLQQYASLDMHFRPDGTFTVPVKIGGSDRNMLVDIGAMTSSVSSRLAGELKLAPEPLRPKRLYFFYFGKVIASTVKLPDVHVGTASIERLDVFLLPDRGTDADLDGKGVPDGVDGILGGDVLRKVDLEFDFKSRKLNVFSQDHCAGIGVVYWADAAAALPFTPGSYSSLRIDMQLDGKHLVVVPSTMETGTAMAMVTVRLLFGIKPSSAGVEVTGRNPDGTPRVFRYGFRSLTAPGVSLVDPHIDLLSDPGGALVTRPESMPMGNYVPLYTEGDVLLGLNELEQFRLFFAFKENALYVTSSDAHK
jgi:hypothetical protein